MDEAIVVEAELKLISQLYYGEKLSIAEIERVTPFDYVEIVRIVAEHKVNQLVN
ncbi:hypothetical protein [Metabacillus litoralis]|uniref:hypothetical protein n=1 Tax=Metabacillus litoralis TaxID=152268 RepID=UPI00203C6879|nr:hypothetical protein [Metabacillus litoralis]MCM3651350.1 hypothetical protein [Metabacillus litoralis]